MILELNHEVQLLTQQVKLLRAGAFGTSSERLDLGQDSLFNTKDEPIEAVADQGEPQSEVSGHKRRKPRRQTLPDDLDVVEEIHDITDEEKQCDCGHKLKRIGEEVTEKLERVPATCQVRKIIRPKYACPCCEGV